MAVGSFLADATAKLKEAGIDSARLDVLILLENALNVDRANILAHPEQQTTPQQELELNNKIAQRAKHIPLAYLLGYAMFYGRRFLVNEKVLVPRPETESMIELLKKAPLATRPIIADIGTGSGCIGITAALEVKDSHVLLCDISPDALNIAGLNTKKLEAKATVKQTNLLQGLKNIDVVLANLPYVPTGLEVNKAVEYEPKLAVFSGDDGLDIYRVFWPQIGRLKPAFVLCESLIIQHGKMAEMALNAGYKLNKTEGLAQQFSL
jgi:release factor glutamine methyltransferase